MFLARVSISKNVADPKFLLSPIPAPDRPLDCIETGEGIECKSPEKLGVSWLANKLAGLADAILGSIFADRSVFAASVGPAFVSTAFGLIARLGSVSGDGLSNNLKHTPTSSLNSCTRVSMMHELKRPSRPFPRQPNQNNNAAKKWIPADQTAAEISP